MPLFILAIIQSLLLAGGQVLLKFALARMLPFAMTLEFWKSVFVNWQFVDCAMEREVSFGFILLRTIHSAWHIR